MSDIISDESNLERAIEALVKDFNNKYPHLFMQIKHNISASNYTDYHSNYIEVETWVNNTGKPIK